MQGLLSIWGAMLKPVCASRKRFVALVACLRQAAQRPKFIFGLTSLWSVPAQLMAYPHPGADRRCCPFLQDSSDAGLHTVVKRTQVLDGKGGKNGCPHRGASLSYYDYLEQGLP
jgi:hypothetical protein